MRTALLVVGGANLLGFGVTAVIKSEVLVDLLGTGSIGLSAVALSLAAKTQSLRATVGTVAIATWSLRLSLFLAYRAYYDGDARLKKFLKSNLALASFFALQGVWGLVMLTPQILSTGLATAVPVTRGAWGLGLAAAGFLIESIADFQKFRFKHSSDGASNKLYTGGLYSIVQFPNYSGEILFWTGLGVYYLSSFGGPQYGILRYVWSFLPATFVTILLLRASGIPLTQKSRAKRYGDDAFYQNYQKQVPKWLIPGIF